ncbi:MAG: hypothetical protein K9K39_02430 [Desulfohalobiaceae bacterium]|nr:hypothetical protein [Desulfohalobiaceae bacterium]
MQVLNRIDFEMNATEIRRRLGISKDSEDWHNVQELMQEMNKTIQAQAAYKPCYIQQKKNESVTIENINFSSKVLRKNLEGVERTFPLVVTLGKNVDEVLKKKDDFLQQYYLDTIANVALQDLLKSLCAQLQNEYNIEQLSYMSPGSLQDWPIGQQRPLFLLLGNVEEEIGVRLAPSMLMYPSKSESGMFFPTEVTFFNCQLCPHANCPSRKAAYDEEKAKEYGVL